VLGKALKDLPRDKIIVATKVCVCVWGGEGGRVWRSAAGRDVHILCMVGWLLAASTSATAPLPQSAPALFMP
jgi:aryl-alcohol dehydrogenase-like predicted oxidoreductase